MEARRALKKSANRKNDPPATSRLVSGYTDRLRRNRCGRISNAYLGRNMEDALMTLNRMLKAAGREKSCCAEYGILESDEERFSYTLRLLQEFKIQPKVKREEKSTAESDRYRKKGNELFVSRKSDEERNTILELYTKCIAYAEPNSQELAFAYGNRSALLFKARLYDHCLRDIDRALRLDCPANLKVKLLTRRIHCSMAVDDSQLNPNEESRKNIDETVDEIQRCIQEMCVDETLKKKFQENLVNSKTTAIPGPQRKLFDEEKHKPATPTENTELPGVSASLKVSYDETFGRHVVATRKILPGEVLVVHKGYATILAPEHFHTHCSNCLRQTWSAVPCNHCVQAVYCDEACREEAWQHHHDVECGVIGAMLHLEHNLLGLMSLRLAIRAVRDAGGFEALKQKLERVDSWPDPRTKGFTGTPPILDESDYSIVYTLAKNTEKRSKPDLFGRSHNSVYIVYCVATMTKFLGEKLPADLDAIMKNPWAVFLGGLITRHQQIIPSNVHTVTEMIGISDRERGASIVPFLSLFNHSCHGMVTRIHYGSHVVVYAVQPIEAGEQVFDNYGMHYALESRFARRLRLQRQFFLNCQCPACEGDWPQFVDLPTWPEQIVDHRDKSKVKNALKKFNRYMDIATNCEIEDKLYMIKDMELMLQILYESVKLPCREINEVEETLKRMYALLSARYQSLYDNY